jgi:hypothetical protein
LTERSLRLCFANNTKVCQIFDYHRMAGSGQL